MIAKYYSQRQLAPCRGMVHVVDVGHALAYTVDGEHWRARLRNREGRLWPVGGWSDTSARFSPTDSAALMEAVNARPPLPFPQADRFELWLLHGSTREPMALLQSRASLAVETTQAPAWRSLVLADADSEADSLRDTAEVGADARWPVSHRETLSRVVNDAARPHRAAQWFVRAADGSGRGLHGVSVAGALAGRRLGRNAFPELLIAEAWDDPTAATLAREYHDRQAAALLTHLDLTRETRRRLERAACRRPEKLAEVFRLIPEFIDRAALEVALVQARLMATSAAAV